MCRNVAFVLDLRPRPLLRRRLRRHRDLNDQKSLSLTVFQLHLVVVDAPASGSAAAESNPASRVPPIAMAHAAARYQSPWQQLFRGPVADADLPHADDDLRREMLKQVLELLENVPGFLSLQGGDDVLP